MTRWLPIPILISSCIVAYDYHVNPTGWYTLALAFLPLTVLLVTLLLWRLPTDSVLQFQPITWQPFMRWQITFIVAGMGCAGIMILAQGDTIAAGMHHALQFVLWLAGVGLVSIGMIGGLPVRRSWQSLRQWMTTTDARWLWLFIGLGFIVRMLFLESAIHYYHDEANFARAVAQLRDDGSIRIMDHIGPIANFAWIYPYLQYIFTELFGATLANLRSISVIIGTLTIPAIYLLGRWTFNHRIGLLAAFLLTFDLPHIHFSRLAYNNIVDPLLGVLAIAFLWRGLQTGSRRMLAGAGIFLGLTGYFYEGGRLLFPALIIGWLMIYALIQNFKIPKRGVLVFFATFLLITAPFYLSFLMRGSQRIAPRYLNQVVHEYFWTEFFTSDDVAAQLSRFLDERLNPPYLHIMSQPDGSEFYYSEVVGLVLPHMLPFLLIGIGVALFYGQRAGLILILWLLLTVFGNALIVRNDWSPRFVVLFPALMMLIALGLELVYRVIIINWLPTYHSRRWLRVVAVLGFALMAFLQMDYYFGVLLPDSNSTFRTKIDDQDAAFRAQSLSADTIVYVLPQNDEYHEDVEVLQAYERHHVVVQVIDVDEFDFGILRASANYAFFIEPQDTRTLTELRTVFGRCLSEPEKSPYNVPEAFQFMLYQVTC